MFYKAACFLFLPAFAVLAQQELLPGTAASAAGSGAASTAGLSSFNPMRSSRSDARLPITPKERVDWIVKSTIGPESLIGGLFSAGWSTGFNRPEIYGPHWEGFGKRYGMRLTGVATSNTMEAGLGALWGEDPRYVRNPGAPFIDRLGHAAKMTFLADYRDRSVKLAYARFIAIPASNFLSNAWRAPGDDTAGDAAVRVGLGFLGRFGSNTFDEFWPDVQRKVFHRSAESPTIRP